MAKAKPILIQYPNWVIDNIDGMVDKGIYASRSEALRDAARQLLIKRMGLEEEMERINKVTEKWKKKVKFKGWPSQEERDKMSMEYIKNLRQ